MRVNTAVRLIAAALACAGSPAMAAPTSLRDVLEFRDERRPPPPPIARYFYGDGGVFVLDRSRRPVLLKFEQNAEVWVLTPSAAPRGDVIYRNDVGAQVLRATKLGGVTLFTAQNPAGLPAGLDGDADGLRTLPSVSPEGLLQRLAQASVRASRAAGRLIPFEAPGVTPGAEPVYAEAASLTADGIVRMSHNPTGRSMMNRFRKVRLDLGRQPGVVVKDGVLLIQVNPVQGAAGRPSSERVARMVAQ
jgi:hypothetical protein